ATKVRIEPAAALNVGGKAAHGYTVAGLIWGQECLWVDEAQNLVALVSTDAEFDHFEAVREAYESSLNDFIASAVQSNLAALPRLSASGRVPPVRDCGNEFDYIRTLHEELDRKQNPAIGPHLEFAGVIDGVGPMTLGAIQA